MADNLVLTSLARPLEGTGIDKDASVIVMTHSFEQDKAILANMTGIALRYIGQLGPRERTERLLSELEAESGVPWQSLTGRLHYPIGLDIGADTPEEIALAIVAEIKAELSERSGRRLGERYGAINDSNLRTEQPSILRAKDPRGVSDSLTRGEANCAITHFIQ
jgi:xanthine/CO dehydrogenase XdhC/CoxF family maturation factor